MDGRPVGEELGTFDGIAQHWYEGPGRHFDLTKAKALPPDAPASDAYVTYEPTRLEYARYAGDVIRRHVEEWQGYQKRFPQMIDKKIFLSIDEYAYGGLGGGGSIRFRGGAHIGDFEFGPLVGRAVVLNSRCQPRKTESDPIVWRAAPFSKDLLEMCAITLWEPFFGTLGAAASNYQQR